MWIRSSVKSLSSKLQYPLVGIIILTLILLCLPLLWLQDYAVSPGPDTGDNATIVHIPGATSLGEIENILAGQSLIRSDIRFKLLALMLGSAGSLKAGHYKIPAGSAPVDILRRLEKGDIVRYQLTVPEGYTVQQIGRKLEKKFGYRQEEFRRLCHDSALIRSLGLEVKGLEGYLFPDTYGLNIDMPLKSLIRDMVQRFQEVYDGLLPQEEDSDTYSLSRHEIVTMASIVEKETSLPAERPLVASVLSNRLRKNMRLQADPTVFYGVNKNGGNLNADDLTYDTPYNSYIYKGLPPGPICNPGRASLEAALRPARTSYLYFVARKDGGHEFSLNLREHINAVNRFQRD
ncbi:MAG: endolytic transglycosylase MltG [Desulfurivibrionaceae bacterium]